MISKLLLAKYLRELECQLEEEMRQPVELQLLNWLEEFIKEIYDEGTEASLADREDEIAQENYKEGYRDGYDKGLSDGELGLK
jgi:hypothetical protein